ncbi:MAG: hypothetical protein R3199_03140 [Gemmatimonadota bacterium]|nr:hypothetical protein [Gemmatimonadota bacterium]
MRERRIPFASEARIERLQRRRLRRIVHHAWATVPFYRRTMRERDIGPGDLRSAADLERLPLLTGKLVRTRLREFRSTRIADGATLKLQSSGSTDEGVRKLVLWDEESSLRKLAVLARHGAAMRRLAGAGWGSRRALLVPEEAFRPLVEFWGDRVAGWSGTTEMEWIPPDLPFPEIVQRLADFRPTVVNSYGSITELFLGRAASRGLEWSPPRVWIYGGDALPGYVRERFEERFGFPIASTYQTSEAGSIGFECERRDGFHVNADQNVVRIVRPDGSASPPGETGEVVVSSLVNRATVILNFRLGDRAAWAAEPCPCGRTLPRIVGLEGRVSDIVRTADGREISAAVLKNALGEPLNRFALQVQLLHPEVGEVVWRIVPFEDTDVDADRRELLRATRTYLGNGTRVGVEVVEEMERSPGGKRVDVVHGDGGPRDEEVGG